MVVAHITPDILVIIGEHLADHDVLEDASTYYTNKQALFSATLVSRQWNHCLMPLLYRKYQNIGGSQAYVDSIPPDTSGRPHYPFLRTLLARPELARLVRTVAIRTWRLHHDYRTNDGDEAAHLTPCTTMTHMPGLRSCLRAALRDCITGGSLRVKTYRHDVRETVWDDALDAKPEDWSNPLTWYWKDAVTLLLLCIIPNVERLILVSHRGNNNCISPFSWHVHFPAIAHGFQKLKSLRIASVHEWKTAYWPRYHEIDDRKSYDWDYILTRTSLQRLSVDDWHVPIPIQALQVRKASNHIQHLRLRYGPVIPVDNHSIILSCTSLITLDYTDSTSGAYGPPSLDFTLVAEQHSLSLKTMRLHMSAANPSIRNGALRNYAALLKLSLTHEIIFGSERVANGVPKPETVESTPPLGTLLPPNVRELEFVNGTDTTAMYLRDFISQWKALMPNLTICRLECVRVDQPEHVSQALSLACSTHDFKLISYSALPTEKGSIIGYAPKRGQDYPPTEEEIENAEIWGATLDTGPPEPPPIFHRWAIWISNNLTLPSSDFFES